MGKLWKSPFLLGHTMSMAILNSKLLNYLVKPTYLLQLIDHCNLCIYIYMCMYIYILSMENMIDDRNIKHSLYLDDNGN